MRDPNNIWKKRFNESSYENEDWLTPASDIFDNITSEIYPEKKRKKTLFIILLLTALFISIAFGLWPSKKTNDLLSKESQTAIEINEHNIKTDLPLASKVSNHNLSESNNSNVDSGFNKKDSINKFNESLKKRSQKKNKSTEVNARKVINQKKNFSPDANDENSLKTNLNKNVIEEDNQINNAIPVKDSEKLFLNKFPAIEKIIVSNIFSTQESKIKSLSVEIAPPVIEVSQPSLQKNLLTFGLGYSNWQFALNSNYSTALNPADFTHSNGSGISGYIDYARPLSQRYNISIGFGIQKISFSSGHNSEINYNLNNEVDAVNNNSFNLIMASPIGFLESDITVERRNNITSNSTDLIVDLNNVHSIVNKDAYLGLDYDIIENQDWNLRLGFKAGINKFVIINNNLENFNLNHDSFSSGASHIINDQNSVNTLTPFIGGHFNISRLLSNNWHIGVAVDVSTNLKPIYQENDFSTQLNRVRSSVFVRKSF